MNRRAQEGANVLDAYAIIQIAAAVGCDPRSVAKYARGEPLRGMLGGRIARAVREYTEREAGFAGASGGTE